MRQGLEQGLEQSTYTTEHAGVEGTTGATGATGATGKRLKRAKLELLRDHRMDG